MANVLLCGYTPFRADDQKEVIRQTTEAMVNFHDRYWKNVSDEAKNFIRALLHPNPARRLTAEQALSHTWLTSFAAPTEHDLSGLRENFDPRARWRNAIGAARAMSRLAKSNGANNHKKDELALSSDDEGDNRSGSASPSDPDTKRQQRYLSSPSPDDRALRGGLAGLVAKGRTTSPSPSSPMSFSDALNKAKTKAAAAETEKAREGDDAPPRAQTTSASQPQKTEADEDDEEEDEVELRIPGSFDFGDRGRGVAAGETPFDAVDMLGNLWRRMQLR